MENLTKYPVNDLYQMYRKLTSKATWSKKDFQLLCRIDKHIGSREVLPTTKRKSTKSCL